MKLANSIKYYLGLFLWLMLVGNTNPIIAAEQIASLSDGSTLQLNGVGEAKQLGSALYLGGLYLTQPTNDKAIISDNSLSRRMSFRFNSRISSRAWKRLWIEYISINTAKDELLPFTTDVQTFVGLFQGAIKVGDQLTIDFIPDQGTIVIINGVNLGTIEKVEFFNLILNTWIGPRPLNEDFQLAILGIKKNKKAENDFENIYPTADRISQVKRWALRSQLLLASADKASTAEVARKKAADEKAAAEKAAAQKAAAEKAAAERAAAEKAAAEKAAADKLAAEKAAAERAAAEKAAAEKAIADKLAAERATVEKAAADKLAAEKAAVAKTAADKAALDKSKAAAAAARKAIAEKAAADKAAAEKAAAEKAAAEKAAAAKAAAEKAAAEKAAADKAAAKKAAAAKAAADKAAAERAAAAKAATEKAAAEKAAADKLAAFNKATAEKQAGSASKTATGDLTDEEFLAIKEGYEEELTDIILENKTYPHQKMRRSYKKRSSLQKINVNIVLLIEIAKDGTVLNKKVIKSSGEKVLDKEALILVGKAKDIPPLPAFLQVESLEVEVVVSYRIR